MNERTSRNTVTIYSKLDGELVKLAEAAINKLHYKAVFTCDDEDGWNVTHFSLDIPNSEPAAPMPLISPVPLLLGKSIQVILPKPTNDHSVH